MAQAFVTSYRNQFRWYDQARRQPIDPDKLTKFELEGDIWFLDLNGEIDEELKNLNSIKEAIHKLYLKRMKSTYQVSHCDNLKPTQSVDVSTLDHPSDKKVKNELLEYCHKLYGPKRQKIIPPLYSARNVFGYMRPSKLQTALTVYQVEYGRVAYKLLKSAYGVKYS
ncbi:uncharacterized protein LOC143190602 [Rhynchophorus ferrugineus]|uniref:uncharacterized protein LOC143190602 n=1 Tax=Rhynchophorus ferrugineus TaxID=354439 RepID=UPI003FCCA4A0